MTEIVFLTLLIFVAALLYSSVGHGGASGRFDFLKEIALDYAFAVWAIEGTWKAA